MSSNKYFVSLIFHKYFHSVESMISFTRIYDFPSFSLQPTPQPLPKWCLFASLWIRAITSRDSWGCHDHYPRITHLSHPSSSVFFETDHIGFLGIVHVFRFKNYPVCGKQERYRESNLPMQNHPSVDELRVQGDDIPLPCLSSR